MNNCYDKLFENSIGNKIYLYNKDESLYTRVIKQDGQVAESMLISEVYPNYVATMISDDSILVACNTKDGDIALLSYNDTDWELEDTINMPPQLDLTLLELFDINGATHLIYATKLPIKNYYSVYHMNYSNNIWKKENIVEIYSENLYTAYSCLKTTDGLIHFANIYHDGSNYQIKYSYYNYKKSIWVSSNITNLHNSNININLLNEDNNLHLICFSNEETIHIFYHFIKKGINSEGFEFDSLTKLKILDIKHFPLFYIYDGSLVITFISENQHYEYKLNKELKEWESYLKVPLAHKIRQSNLVVYQNSITSNKSYCFADENYKIVLPIRSLYKNVKEGSDISKIQQEYYIPYLLDQIKVLSEEIKLLNAKLNKPSVNLGSTANMMSDNYSTSEQKASYKAKIISEQSSSKAFTEKFIRNPKQNCDFKNKFMHSDSYLQNLDSGFASKVTNLSKPHQAENTLMEKPNSVKKSFKQNFNSGLFSQTVGLKSTKAIYDNISNKDIVKRSLTDIILKDSGNIKHNEHIDIQEKLQSHDFSSDSEDITKPVNESAEKIIIKDEIIDNNGATEDKELALINTTNIEVAKENNLAVDIPEKTLVQTVSESDKSNDDYNGSVNANTNFNGLMKKLGDLFK